LDARRFLDKLVTALWRFAEVATGHPSSADITAGTVPDFEPRQKGLGRLIDSARFGFWLRIADLDDWKCHLPDGRWPVVRRLTRAPEHRVRKDHPLDTRVGNLRPRSARVQVTLSEEARDSLLMVPACFYDLLPDVLPGWDTPLTYVPDWLHLMIGEDEQPYEPAPMPMMAEAAGLLVCCGEAGTLTFHGRKAQAAPSGDSVRVDVVDAVFPLYVLLVAVSSGAYSRMLRGSGLRRPGRLSWEAVFPERLFDISDEGSRLIFPGRVPPRLAEGAGLPREITVSGWELIRRRCSPTRIVASVLAELMVAWGYEPEPAVIDEVLGLLEVIRVGKPSLRAGATLQDP
jgi:hypothetical protein